MTDRFRNGACLPACLMHAFGSGNMGKPCEVCAACEAKYKCPSCRLPYCSAACYKQHKEAPCGPAAAPDGAQPASAQPDAQPDAQPVADAAAAAAVVTPTTASATETESEEDEELPRLTDAQLNQLRSSEFVRKQLANPALVQALSKIDAASDRMKELEKAMLDQTFASFICQSLDEATAAGATTSPA